jgi:carbamoyltransferase
MDTLGLGVFADSSASIIRDGKIICAVEEERLNGIKHYDGIPWMAIEECLEIAELNLKQIDKIAIGWNPYRGWVNRIGHSLNSVKSGLEDLKTKANRGSGYFARCKEIFLLNRNLKKRFLDGFVPKKFFYVNHHLSHASSTYFSSPFNECNIVVADGVGESETVTFFKAKGKDIVKKFSIHYPNSLGHLYSSITGFLGYKMTCDEGKIMALASFGEDEYKPLFEELLKVDYNSGKIKLNCDILDYHLARIGIFKKKFINKTGLLPRKNDEPINYKHQNLAYSLQNRIENVILSLLKIHFPEGQNKPLCSAGGLFLNSVLNGKIIQEFTNKYYIFPACGDNGVSVGAAYYIDSLYNSAFKKHFLSNASLGRNQCFKDNSVNNLDNLEYNYSNDIYEVATKLINAGNIVGWFNGRMEFGPRALGNRSILASPLFNGIKDKVNNKVKHRENYRPFACALLEEEIDKYFINAVISPFMLKVFKFKNEYKNIFPSINHIDNTCRIQTVNKENNPYFYKLLLKMKEKTGYGIILNTSMNDAGQPIVNTPQQAIDLLLKTDLDYLIVDNYIIKKKKNWNYG